MRAVLTMGVLALLALVADAKPKPRPPTSVVFVIDRSGSMQGQKLETAKEAVLAAIDALGPNDVASLVVFDSEAQIVFRDQPKTKRAALKKHVPALTSGRP